MEINLFLWSHKMKERWPAEESSALEQHLQLHWAFLALQCLGFYHLEKIILSSSLMFEENIPLNGSIYCPGWHQHKGCVILQSFI